MNGKHVRSSCETDDWARAETVRDLYGAKKGIGRVPAPILEEAPRFKDLAKRYLKTATHLAESMRADRELHLAEDGQLVAHFEERRVDEIIRGDILEWWEAEIVGRGRAINTGLNSLAGVFDLVEILGASIEVSETHARDGLLLSYLAVGAAGRNLHIHTSE